MADETQAPFTRRPFATAPEAGGGQRSTTSPADAHRAAEHDPFAERPEVYVGAAFAGGLVLAGLLRVFGR